MDGLSQPALLDVAPKRRKRAMLFNPKEFKLGKKPEVGLARQPFKVLGFKVLDVAGQFAALAYAADDASGVSSRLKAEIEGTVMTAEVWHKSRRAEGGVGRRENDE